MKPYPLENADLVTFTKEIRHEEFHIFFSARAIQVLF